MKHAWTIPALVAALTLTGLLVALVADGPGDVLGWIALLAPALIGARILLRRAGRSAER